jgi:hypothetical protein
MNSCDSFNHHGHNIVSGLMKFSTDLDMSVLQCDSRVLDVVDTKSLAVQYVKHIVCGIQIIVHIGVIIV